MQIALNSTGQRIVAAKGLTAMCPCCRTRVVAKCGEIKIWHWAHESLKDCDAWSEGETRWHAGWKSKWPEVQREVVLTSAHRADVLTKDGHVIEFQSRMLSPEEFRERETFYGSRSRGLVWVIKANGSYENDRLQIVDKHTHANFRWRWEPKSLLSCQAPVFLHFSTGQLLEIARTYSGRVRGWGRLWKVSDFLKRFGAEPKKES